MVYGKCQEVITHFKPSEGGQGGGGGGGQLGIGELMLAGAGAGAVTSFVLYVFFFFSFFPSSGPASLSPSHVRLMLDCSSVTLPNDPISLLCYLSLFNRR
jgi:hypothetical protein